MIDKEQTKKALEEAKTRVAHIEVEIEEYKLKIKALRPERRLLKKDILELQQLLWVAGGEDE